LAILPACLTCDDLDWLAGMFDGVLDFYVWNGIPCVRTWPRSDRYYTSPAQRDSAAAFRQVGAAKALMPEVLRRSFAAFALGSTYSWSDVMTAWWMAYYRQFGEVPPAVVDYTQEHGSGVSSVAYQLASAQDMYICRVKRVDLRKVYKKYRGRNVRCNRPLVSLDYTSMAAVGVRPQEIIYEGTYNCYWTEQVRARIQQGVFYSYRDAWAYIQSHFPGGAGVNPPAYMIGPVCCTFTPVVGIYPTRIEANSWAMKCRMRFHAADFYAHTGGVNPTNVRLSIPLVRPGNKTRDMVEEHTGHLEYVTGSPCVFDLPYWTGYSGGSGGGRYWQFVTSPKWSTAAYLPYAPSNQWYGYYASSVSGITCRARLMGAPPPPGSYYCELTPPSSDRWVIGRLSGGGVLFPVMMVDPAAG